MPQGYARVGRLVNAGVLAQVDELSDQVNQMAVATKKDGCLQVCIDSQSLNLNALIRQHYQLPVLEETPPRLTSAMGTGTASWTNSLHPNVEIPVGWLPFRLSVSSEVFQPA